MTLRLSITTVEAYRYWRDHEDASLDDLLASIRKDLPANEAMIRGSAFHAVIEAPEAHWVGAKTLGALSYYEANGLCFDADGIQRVLRLLPGDRVAEVKTTYDLDGITLSGVADALHGLDVYEAKCTGRIDTEKYFDSFQWRAYLVMFNARRVRYLLAQYKDGGLIEISNVLTMPMYRYPALLDDVRRLANECAEFVVSRGLESYCADREAEAA